MFSDCKRAARIRHIDLEPKISSATDVHGVVGGLKDDLILKCVGCNIGKAQEEEVFLS